MRKKMKNEKEEIINKLIHSGKDGYSILLDVTTK
jgi:hypothetical protein